MAQEYGRQNVPSSPTIARISIVQWEESWGGEEIGPLEVARALPLEEGKAIEGDWEFIGQKRRR